MCKFGIKKDNSMKWFFVYLFFIGCWVIIITNKIDLTTDHIHKTYHNVSPQLNDIHIGFDVKKGKKTTFKSQFSFMQHSLYTV